MVGMQLDAGKVDRKEYLMVSPEEILLNLEDNTRKNPHDKQHIRNLAESMLEDGQKVPIVVRKLSNKKLKVIAGFGRLEAAQLINAELSPGGKFKIKVIVETGNEEDAYKTSYIENMMRAELKPIDHAHTQNIFRDRFGWDDEKIAKFSKQTVKYVEQLKELLSLPTSIQEDMKNGDLSMNAATVLTTLPEKEAKAVVEESRRLDGKVDATAVIRKVRTKKIENGEKGRALSQKEINELILRLKAGNGKVSDMAYAFGQHITGNTTEEDLVERLKQIVGEEDND